MEWRIFALMGNKDYSEIEEAVKILEQFFSQLSQEEKEVMLASRTSNNTDKVIRDILNAIFIENS